MQYLSSLVTLVILAAGLCLNACSSTVRGHIDRGLRPQQGLRFDTVIAGGRVLDPETELDGIRHLGISEGRIALISEAPLNGRLAEGGKLIDASGLVVAPGFIDLHAHGMSDKALEYRARDGVTTVLELEWGYPQIAPWLEARLGNSRIHYGASVSHGHLRAIAMPELKNEFKAVDAAFARVLRAHEPLNAYRMISGFNEATYRDLAEEDTPKLYRLLERGLLEGGLGIGMAHQYYPGASRREILRVFQFAAEQQVPIFTHVREMDMSAMQEVIANAAATGAPLHIVHANSMGGDQLPEILELIAGARGRGLDITTEAYPYTAASTGIQSTIFDEGWQERLGISYGDIQWQDTGERLTEESFARYREQGGVVIMHFMKNEMIDLAMSSPFVIVASDAMPYAAGAHPRSAGTFARVLGHYVRERGVLDLMTAIRKMTLLPAQRMQGIAPVMARKGRIQVGADADLCIFDPETVIDTADFITGLSYSKGIEHVFVLGTAVVQDGELVTGATPGRPISSR
ncbi:MAG: amidohydrolase family protein [Planctomycetota bacterium]